MLTSDIPQITKLLLRVKKKRKNFGYYRKKVYLCTRFSHRVMVN